MKKFIVIVWLKNDHRITLIFTGAQDEADAVNKIDSYGMGGYHEIIGCCEDYEAGKRHIDSEIDQFIALVICLIIIILMIYFG